MIALKPIEGNKLEIGIETKEAYRHQGYGTIAAKALIAYCLENGFEPIWACKHDNLSSVHTAKKLGFDIIFEGPYYEMMKNV